ncbi:MAG: YrhC family protein [Tuberibacillus sp.]
MNDHQLKHLKLKMVDFKRFSLIFLFISAFLNIGSALPFDGKTEGKAEIMILTSFLFLFISLFFYWRMRKAKKAYEENI